MKAPLSYYAIQAVTHDHMMIKDDKQYLLLQMQEKCFEYRNLESWQMYQTTERVVRL